MKVFPLRVSTCDSSGVPISDIGVSFINLSNGTGTGRVTQNTDDMTALQNFWNNYMSYSDFNSFGFVQPPEVNSFYTEQFRLLIPGTIVLASHSASYLRITNASGFYAVGETDYYGGVSFWTLYNNNGEAIMGGVPSSNCGLPLSSGSTFCFLISTDDTFSDNTLRVGKQYARLASPHWSTREVSEMDKTYKSSVIQWLQGLSPDFPPTVEDPYEAGGGDTGDDDTDGKGGTGDFDGTTDPIDFPDLPTVSAVDTKFITIFNPSKAQLTSLAEYMWSPLFDIDTLKKLWADPMDCILGLTMVPFSVPNGGTGTVSIGNVSTGISMTKAGSQYVAIDCGSINVKEFWGGYLDYDPYTKFQIYLPYVGIKPLLADEIMGKSIHVKYHCDILTGACNCFVKCDGSVLYSFNGQCSTQIPISGNDWRNTISAAINIAGQAAGMYVSGGSTAPMAISSIAQSAVNGLKQTVEKSGSLSGTGGMLAIQKPYLIATRPKQAVPKNQNKFTGYPAFITRTLSSCSGYTEVYSCHLENIPCTADELNEIENLLKSGVIL